MKLVKIFLVLIILLLLLFFLIENNDKVNINLIFESYQEVAVSIVMLGALAVGILIGFGAAVLSILTVRAENRSLRQRHRQVSEELNDLRNVAIDEGIYDTESHGD